MQPFHLLDDSKLKHTFITCMHAKTMTMQGGTTKSPPYEIITQKS